VNKQPKKRNLKPQRGFRAGALIIVGILLLLGAGCGQDERLTQRLPPGRIVYAHTVWDHPGGARVDLWMIYPDGTGKKPITRPARERDGMTTNHGAMWSPDGRMLAYQEVVVHKPRRGEYRIKIVDASDPATFLHDVVGHGLGWSPNGRAFLFTKTRAAPDLHILNLGTGETGNLTESIPGEKRFGPTTYTSDGSIVTFARLSAISDPWQIFVMDSHGKNVRALTDSHASGPAADLNPRFGGTLVVQRMRENEKLDWQSDTSEERGTRLYRFMYRERCVALPGQFITWRFVGRRNGRDIYRFAWRIPTRGVDATTPVVGAARDLSLGVTLSRSDLALTTISETNAPASRYIAKAEGPLVIGRRLLAPAERGRPFLWSNIEGNRPTNGVLGNSAGMSHRQYPVIALGDSVEKEIAYEGKRVVVIQNEFQRVSIIPPKADLDNWRGFGQHHIRSLSAGSTHAVFALRHVNGHTLCKVDLQNGGYETIGPCNKDALMGVNISPDGTRIAFVRAQQDAGRTETCVIGIDGAGLRVIEENGGAPSWGPDSRHIVYVKTPQAVYEPRVRSESGKRLMADMVIAELATGKKRVLTRSPFVWFGYGVAWSENRGD